MALTFICRTAFGTEERVRQSIVTEAHKIGVYHDHSVAPAKVSWLTKRLAVALVFPMSIGAILLVATGRVGILRLALVAGACLLLPGLGWALRLQLRDAGDKLALAVGISISVITLVGTTMAVTGRWSTSGGAIALLAVAITGFLSRGVLKAIGAGLKWFIDLFAGPEAYPAVTVPDDRPVADGDESIPPISGEDLRSPSTARTSS